MKKPSDPPDDWDNMRDKIIGLGERSLRKSYYPELQRQLEAVQQSEERFRLLVEHTHDGILIIEGGAIQYANPRLSEILGEAITTLSEDSMVAKLLAGLDMAHILLTTKPEPQKQILPSLLTSPLLLMMPNAQVSGVQHGANARAKMAKPCASRCGVLIVRMRSKRRMA